MEVLNTPREDGAGDRAFYLMWPSLQRKPVPAHRKIAFAKRQRAPHQVKSRIVPIEYTIVVILRALVEVAGYLMIGQATLFVLAGAKREGNFVYQLFRKGATPVYRFTRLMTPRIIIDKHIPFVAFLLLVWVWLALAYAKRALCVAHQLQCGL